MNVIVTGGSGDIGGACARLLAARGDDVLIVDSDGGAAERLASEINEGTGGHGFMTGAVLPVDGGLTVSPS